mmetsp:Transcript_15276/g.27669  ORF Transcript_15276/g.27669 Transcript_15276/m.27669 type:complete len:414 (-) Transcript_15276:74-1315(-)
MSINLNLNWKSLVAVIVFAVYMKHGLIPRALPYGPAVPVALEDRPVFSDVDLTNDSLRAHRGKLSKIYERVPEGVEPLMKGPETVVFGNDGTMYVLTEDGNFVSLTDFEYKDDGITITAKTSLVVDLGMGRPLGGKISKDDTLYAADTLLGLIQVQNVSDPRTRSKVQLVASKVMTDDGWSQILYADDVDIGSKSGIIYFSDASEIPPDRMGTRTWDTMYASKTDFVRGKRTGRLLSYNPKSDEVKVLATGIWFANGIAVDQEETFVMVSETFSGRILRYNLVGEKQGQMEVMTENLPGYPDGADCSYSGSGFCYAPFPSSALPLMKIIFGMAHPFDTILRTLVMMIPKAIAPDIIPYGGFVEIDPLDGGTVQRIIQDPTGKDIQTICGVTEHENKLYLGSLHNPFVGVYDFT